MRFLIPSTRSFLLTAAFFCGSLAACASTDASTAGGDEGEAGQDSGGEAGASGGPGSAGKTAGSSGKKGGSAGAAGGAAGSAGSGLGGQGGIAGLSGAGGSSAGGSAGQTTGGASGQGNSGGSSGTGGASAGGQGNSGGAAGQAGAGGSAAGGAGRRAGGEPAGGAAGNAAGGVGGEAGAGQSGAGMGGEATGGAGMGEAGTGGAGVGGAAAGMSGAAGAATCEPVTAQADVDPWSVRAKSAGFGGIATAKSGAYTDVFLQSPAAGATPANYIRIGARLDWGGSIVFFGLGDNPNSNVIDANDTGRELQIALYDPTRIHQPCAGTASCESNPQACGDSITYLGWDPVQGGDECGHGGQVIDHTQVGDALRLNIQPLQWNPDWEQPSCQSSACGASGLPAQVTYTFELRFLSTNVVEVMTQVNSQESFDHPATAQEFPTLYVAHGKNGPDLPLLLDAGGALPAIDQNGNDGFFHGEFASPRPWVTYQNKEKNYGVGIGHDQGLLGFQGWRGDGKTAPYFHNVRAQIAFGLPAKGTVRGLSYLALGSFDTVKVEIEKSLAARPPFGHLDAPAAGLPAVYAPGESISVGGWVLDNALLDKVRVEIDGQPAAEAPITVARPDVCATYPAYPGCPQSGFSVSVPTGSLSPCPHLLRVIAQDADGNATTLGERVIEPG